MLSSITKPRTRCDGEARSGGGSRPSDASAFAETGTLVRMDSHGWDQHAVCGHRAGLDERTQPLPGNCRRRTAWLQARALDLACGEGGNAIWLAERGWQATGVDFSKVGLEKARQLEDARGVHPRVDHRRPARLPTCSPGTFELVIVFYLQVPAAERTPILKPPPPAVAPAGTFLLVGHDASNIAEGSRQTAGPCRPLHRRGRHPRPTGNRPADRASRTRGATGPDTRGRADRARRPRARIPPLSRAVVR